MVSTSTQFIPKILRKMGDMVDDTMRGKLADLVRTCKTSSKKLERPPAKMDKKYEHSESRNT